MNENELQQVIEEGEGYKIEFKESLANLDKELVAFANSSGGRIFVGITDDNEIKGVRITNKFKSQVQDIANNCQPAVKILFDELGNVLLVTVREGEDKPYKCSSGFYTRVGPNAQKLDRDEIVEFFKSEGKIRFDELVNPRFDYDSHFDPQKFDRFLKLAGISKVLDVESILVNLGIAERQEGRIILNNTGILFFSKNLDDIYFHTAVTCALYRGTEKVDVLDRRDLNEDLISSIDSAMIFLKQYIPVRYEMTGGPRRREVPEVPYDALREAVINAVAHRDYFEKGANVMVEMFDDRIEITSYGGLVKSLKPEDFGKKSVLRNPNIANLLQRAGYIEKMGTGINKIKRLVAEAGLPPVEFEFDTFFTVIFHRPGYEPVNIETKKEEKAGLMFDKILYHDGVREGVDDGVHEGVDEGVKARLKKEIEYLIVHEHIRRIDLEQVFSISTATAERDLSILKRLGIVVFEGTPKTGRYVLTEKGKRIIEEMG
ncbi:MAG: putative DNA binding domain-containing protein [Candidatus Omnitrophica bacterium]|nr:putative DNA binding domain-containing protein [Candidatus Omnitrophota bacterium]